MFLELQDIEKSFDSQPVLRSISLSVAAGEIVALLGPSGSGKTTLLRIIAGLTEPDGGQLWLDGRPLSNMPIHQRGFGYVFQDFALFPHKDVFQNVAFGLRMLGWERERIAWRVDQVLDLVGLTGFGRRAVYELSGGEQQRVALARSLAPAPRLILLDEPLGALDQALRERLMGELRAILKRAGQEIDDAPEMTAVYVTHDQAEAFAIADRVVIMNDGRIEQEGPPLELYRCPASRFVARFLGMDNLLDGAVVSRSPRMVETALGVWQVGGRGAPDAAAGRPVTVLVRPEAARIVDESETVVNELIGRLTAVSFRGRFQQATVAVAAGDETIALEFEFDSTVALPSPGEPLVLALDPEAIVLLDDR